MEHEYPERIEFALSDYAEIGSLQEYLGLATDIHIERLPGRPGASEQGALDILAVVAAARVLVAVVKTIPEFLRSRRSNFSVTTTFKGKKFVLTARNVKEELPALLRLLDE